MITRDKILDLRNYKNSKNSKKKIVFSTFYHIKVLHFLSLFDLEEMIDESEGNNMEEEDIFGKKATIT